MFAQFKTFTLLLFVSTAVHYVACETLIIVPIENSTLCPESEICYTLNEYASMNSNVSSNLDTIMLELQPGTHTLDVPLAVRSISSFTMRGNNATLECKQRFNVTRTESVTLRGLSLINCGARSQQDSIFEFNIFAVTDLVFEDSSFQSDEPFYIWSATNIQIINSTFTRCPRGVLTIYSVASLLIRNCTFSDNIQANRSSIGVVSFSGSASSLVTIETTVFRNNHMTGRHTTGAFQGSGRKLTIVNSTFLENSGGPIGAGAIHSYFESVTISRCEFGGNYAQDSTGAVTLTGRNTVVVINRTVFFNNTSIEGYVNAGAVGVLSAEGSLFTIEDSIFYFNKGVGRGAFGFSTSDNSSILISNCNFTQNTVDDLDDGGAIDILGGNMSLTVLRSTFRGNRVTGSGGAMYLRGLRMVLINESTFESNSANDGGAISIFYSEQNYDSKVVIANSIFTGNNANFRCGVLTVSALRNEYLLHSRAVQVFSSEFISNTQSRDITTGSGAMCLTYTNASLVNSNFNGNSQRALTIQESEITVDGCTFKDNFVERFGGAVYGNNINGTFNETVFMNNRAGDSGGAVYLSNSRVGFYDSTFRSNVASRGAAISIVNGGSLEIDDSNIFDDNTATLGSVISACDGAGTNVNVSGLPFVSIDETFLKKCIIYSNQLTNDAISIKTLSLASLTIFLSSMIIVALF